jgi:ComF family protein
VIDLLFPNRCIECSRIIHKDELVCVLCFEQIDFTHHRFHESNLLKEKCGLLFPIQNAFALMQFGEEGLSREIIHQLKYGNRELIGKILAEWVSERIFLEKEKFDLLISVPLHPKKLRKRGYNQLHLFTETLSEKFGIPFDHTLIKRNSFKKAQARKRRDERAQTENIFSITKKNSGKHILLIDDVFTTGNTIASAAWEILKSGNNKISVLVMAVD